ncbi:MULTISPECIES: DUF1073 domain-containing protein [Mycetohabitans]|nr:MULTISPECIES: DUF1073 domain-containing protein [Mycetohabitans]MCF7695274.1 DUF1073 domain-containing protein [Mycetohabitans sp. B2]
MFNWLRRKDEPPQAPETPKSGGFFTTEHDLRVGHTEAWAHLQASTFQRSVADDFSAAGAGMDANELENSVKRIAMLRQENMPAAQVGWYASQSFIGYQLCALIAQHWLVDKACAMPGKDAIRNGYTVTVNDGTRVDAGVIDAIRKEDKRFRINHQMREFVRMGRVFGIRIAMFVVQSTDPEYYAKPFNPDGVTPGSYKGIRQIDPYWAVPELSSTAVTDPTSLHFYEPTYWRINGKPIHHSHLIILRIGEVPDVLKPTYYYGGVPVPQKIFERVYASERTANEAPLLAMSKRSTVIHMDVENAVANQAKFEQRMATWAHYRDNHGIKVVGTEEQIEQFDTALADFDAVIMTQYQLVAAAANVPATKLLGTSPKGFNATGEFEEASYHEELESIQAHDLTPLLDRHHLLVIRSEIVPKFGVPPFETTVAWNPLDSMTAKERAEVNKMEAETGAILVQSGAIDGIDERRRITQDPTSGYTGIEQAMPADPFDDSNHELPEHDDGA